MSYIVRTLLGWLAFTSLAGAADWSVCPGLDEPRAEATSPRYEVFGSPYTYHWSKSDEHRPVFALSFSRLLPNDRFCGVSAFRNSFGQPSAYAFTGWTAPSPFASLPNMYGSITAGIIYGYVGKYKDKVPLNVGGFSPVIIPSIGYRLTPNVAVEMHVLGAAALMFGTAVRF